MLKNEDILELGWKKDNSIEAETPNESVEEQYVFWRYKKLIQLWTYKNSKEIYIFCYTDGEGTLFTGDIENKEELIVLMRQLRIKNK